MRPPTRSGRVVAGPVGRRLAQGRVRREPGTVHVLEVAEDVDDAGGGEVVDGPKRTAADWFFRFRAMSNFLEHA